VRSFVKFVLLGLFLFVAVAFRPGNPPSPEDEAKAASEPPTKSLLRTFCALGIEPTLREPSSVEWIGRDDWPVVVSSPEIATVAARYRARNGFGGMSVEARICTVTRKKDGDWNVRSVAA
jgi:hypothetical protein